MTSTLSWPVQNIILRKYSFKPTFFSGLSSPLRTSVTGGLFQYLVYLYEGQNKEFLPSANVKLTTVCF